MSFSALTVATLMVSASTNASIEPSNMAAIEPVFASASQPIVTLNPGSLASSQSELFPQVQLIDSIERLSGGDQYLSTQTNHAPAAALEILNLPVYLPSPTAAGATLTIGSTLAYAENGIFQDQTSQPTEPDQNDDNVIIVTAPDRRSSVDPLSAVNAETFEIAQDIDRSLVEPVATAYKEALPSPIRSGLRNFISNLGEPVVFLNYLLQFKPGKAAETLGRFAINSTIGIGGVFDVAKKEPFNLPNRFNGFANTMGFYGIKPGPYLYLPLAGSTTVRDFIGDSLDLLFLPTFVGKPFTQPVVTTPIGVLRALDRRIQRDDEIREMQEESDDPYVSARKQYLEMRQMEIDILRGRIPDPLSRKNRAGSGNGAKNDLLSQQEAANLWYLKQ